MAISSSNVKIYSDSACTNLVTTVNGTTAASQSINVTGLSEHTNYWAKASATNAYNQTGTSDAYAFTTLWAQPNVSVVASNITSTTATLTFNYSGNYPIDTSNYTDVSAYWCVSNSQNYNTVQFHSLDNGVPEVLNLTGLTPNTTYYAEIEVDYGDGLANDSITFTTLSSSAPSIVIDSVTNITPNSARVNVTITE